MYRPSDANCSLPDAAPVEEKEIPFREKWDCLSKEATQQVSSSFFLSLTSYSPGSIVDWVLWVLSFISHRSLSCISRCEYRLHYQKKTCSILPEFVLEHS